MERRKIKVTEGKGGKTDTSKTKNKLVPAVITPLA